MAPHDVGVYVHVPFCERVCPYCDFAVVGVRQLEPELERRYVDALCAELERRRGAFAGRGLASLYLGGGTPSLLRPEAVARLVEAVRGAFPGGDAAEVTLEVNPGSVERERLPGFRAAGVNRVSVGVQSFQDLTLKRLGRAHRGDEARRTLAAARDAGFPVLCLDLMLAAPEQGPELLEADLAEALAHAPEHVSVYELTLEPGTPFAKAAARGRLELPDEEAALRLLEAAEARLVAAGYERYEISNYARPGFAAVHNRRYWERRPVLGLGVGAVSNDPPTSEAPHGVRRANSRSPERYLEAVEAGRGAEGEPAERLSPEVARGEAVFLALRSARGLDARRFAAEFGAPPRAFWAGAIEALCGEGLLQEGAPGDLRLTARGRRVADAVFQHFV